MIQWFEVDKKKCWYSKGWKDTIFAPKQQNESIHLPIESIQKLGRLNPDEGKYKKIDEVKRYMKRFKLHRWMFESIQDNNESIQRESESLMIRLKKEWYDSNMNRFIHSVNRFIQGRKLFWDDSDRNESIHVNTRHKWKGANMNSYKLPH